MQCNLDGHQEVADKACQAATGKTLKQWFGELDGVDALALGRRKTTMHLMEHKVPEWWMTTIAVEYEKHKDQKKKDGLYEGYGICATKTIAAPLAYVYGHWSDARNLSQWFGKAVKAEVVDGGSFSTKDGDSGKYLRVRPNKDLRFTYTHPRATAATQVDVTFEDKGKRKTLIMANHGRIQTRAEADALRAAWGEALDRLKALCEK